VPERPPTPETAEPPGVGHNEPPEPIEPDTAKPNSDEIPDLPLVRPDRTYPYGRIVADALKGAIAVGNWALATAIANAADAVGWLTDQYYNIAASLDPAKTYEELVADAQVKGPRRGYENHHIVEQGGQNSYLDQSEIQSGENIVRIPYYRHKDVQSYYQTPNPLLGGLTPREYLRGRSFQEQFEFGLKVLRDLGIMK